MNAHYLNRQFCYSELGQHFTHPLLTLFDHLSAQENEGTATFGGHPGCRSNKLDCIFERIPYRAIRGAGFQPATNQATSTTFFAFDPVPPTKRNHLSAGYSRCIQ